MSEEAKKNIGGGLMAKSLAEDRKASPPAIPPTPLKKVIIKSADMLPDMQKEAVDIAVTAFEKHNVEKDVAENIKKEFDKRHGPTWHCIVGRNFGSLSLLFISSFPPLKSIRSVLSLLRIVHFMLHMSLLFSILLFHKLIM